MAKILYTSRTPVQQYQRCKRLRWLGNYEGAAGQGLEPARKSSHLVVGGAVHAGMEVLLRDGQAALDEATSAKMVDGVTGAVLDLGGQLDWLFVNSKYADGRTLAQVIEDRAVTAALAEFNQAWAAGVELDPEEARQRAAAAGQTEVVNDFADLVANPIGRAGGVGGAASPAAESPIVVDFADFGMVGPTTTQISRDELAQMYPPAASAPPAWQPFDQDAWLKEEMAALVEGMVRCWARRRLESLLRDHIIIEVEQEGCWKLAEWGATVDYDIERVENPATHELYFLSRHDALLLERATGYLYLQSFKTTGSWDRRKELDAQVDMQGLSEAVDVERRFHEAWELIHKEILVAEAFGPSAPLADNPEYLDASQRVRELVSDRVAHWLRSLPDPPTILGVRYEYLLKGSRREDKKAQPGEPRWNQESILCRAYSQEGITSADRRWAWTYDWKDEGGKGRRLDYKSWRKTAVWRAMKVSEWIDLLDAGKVQEGALGEEGEVLDALAAQLVPVVVAYRAQDEMLDLLEQLESQEVQVAKDVEAVREAERIGGYAAKRSELNRRFGQNRQACSYPGLCAYRSTATQPGFCFGPPDAEHDAGVMEHYRPRQANHPKELAGLVQIGKAE